MLMRKAFVLVGPTATGKSEVAQILAERLHAAILSADAMLVYEGMNIGTAKPTAEERGAVSYLGIDLVTPDQDFDLWRYLQLVEKQVAALPPEQPVLVVGGTGLYVRALTEGLDSDVAAPTERVRWEQLFADKGVAGLQATLRELDSSVLAGLPDPCNPRRLIRAIEQVVAKESDGDASRNAAQRSWQQKGDIAIFAGLQPEPGPLRQRIAARVEKMYKQGLLAEAQALHERYPTFSRSAHQAIGYHEAFAVMDGSLSESAAKERTVIRTNRLAKRQRTWFRHQAEVEWVVPDIVYDVEQLAMAVEQIWRKHGPVQLRFP